MKILLCLEMRISTDDSERMKQSSLRQSTKKGKIMNNDLSTAVQNLARLMALIVEAFEAGNTVLPSMKVTAEEWEILLTTEEGEQLLRRFTDEVTNLGGKRNSRYSTRFMKTSLPYRSMGTSTPRKGGGWDYSEFETFHVLFHRPILKADFEIRDDVLFVNNREVKLVSCFDFWKKGGMEEFFEGLKTQEVLNVDIRDFMLDHPSLIPKCWRDDRSLRFGTIYYRKSNKKFPIWKGLGWNRKTGKWMRSSDAVSMAEPFATPQAEDLYLPVLMPKK